MNSIRSVIFYIIFYMWTIAYFIVFSFVSFFSLEFTIKVSEFWTKSVMNLCKWILLVEYKIIGEKNIPKPPFIIVSNHQSAWETFFLPCFFTKSIFILKKSLNNIPIFKGYFKKLGYILIDRDLGYSSIKNLLGSAKKSIKLGTNSIIIFPEGTRLKPNEKKEINSGGVLALYKYLKLPILPISHNSGEFWKNQKFTKCHGIINIKIFKPIEFGLSKKEVIKELNNLIFKR